LIGNQRDKPQKILSVAVHLEDFYLTRVWYTVFSIGIGISECSQNQIVFSAQLIGGESETNRARETGDQSRMEKGVWKKCESTGRTKISTVGVRVF
jgi:hypothetical protein